MISAALIILDSGASNVAELGERLAFKIKIKTPFIILERIQFALKKYKYMNLF
jgi:hypothetical protein